ncbi:MAG: hypothetical protein AB8B85_16230 [Paracoccaceae bacterium]
MNVPILVCGFLGAGKSDLVTKLTDAGFVASELEGLSAPSVANVPKDTRIIAIVDCANFGRQWDDPLIGPLLRRQIGASGLVALSRADLADPEPVRAILSNTGPGSVVNNTEVTENLNLLLETTLGTPGPEDNLHNAFESWSYQGPARMRPDRAERLAEDRPKGLVRLVARIATDAAGVEIQIAGRVRQTAPISAREQTEITAIWPVGVVRRSAMDLWFAEAVADSSHGFGMFNYR